MMDAVEYDREIRRIVAAVKEKDAARRFDAQIARILCEVRAKANRNKECA